jgi:hypothetical protein
MASQDQDRRTDHLPVAVGFAKPELHGDLSRNLRRCGGSMSEKSLKALAAGLRSQLAQAHGLDEQTRQGLQELAREVEDALDPSTVRPPTVPGTLRDRLADRVRELEVSHPRLTTTLSSIIDTLAFYNL